MGYCLALASVPKMCVKNYICDYISAYAFTSAHTYIYKCVPLRQFHARHIGVVNKISTVTLISILNNLFSMCEIEVCVRERVKFVYDLYI